MRVVVCTNCEVGVVCFVCAFGVQCVGVCLDCVSECVLNCVPVFYQAASVARPGDARMTELTAPTISFQVLSSSL